jgi:protein-L-isoaspartate(D-aspartate) O-methyltransferase
MDNAWRVHADSNAELIAGLMRDGIIKSKRVADAMRAVPREHYCSTNAGNLAWVDRPVGTMCGQTISAPHMHAYALETLQEQAAHGAKVLDVGSGSGYLAACFGEMVGPSGTVIGIDVFPELVQWSQQNLRKGNPGLVPPQSRTANGQLAPGVHLLVGDGWKGMPSEAPFDAIHVGAAAAEIPQALVDQLKPGGRLLLPVGPEGLAQHMYVVDKHRDGTISKQRLLGVQYVPLIRKKD